MALLTLISLPLISAVCSHNPGVVYILEEDQDGSDYYKIGGSTRGAETRRDEIQIGNPRALLVAEEFDVDDCYDAEEEAHDTARDLMYVTNIVIRGNPTEWYEVDEDDYEDFVDAIEEAVADLLKARAQAKAQKKYKELLEQLFSIEKFN